MSQYCVEETSDGPITARNVTKYKKGDVDSRIDNKILLWQGAKPLCNTGGLIAITMLAGWPTVLRVIVDVVQLILVLKANETNSYLHLHLMPQ